MSGRSVQLYRRVSLFRRSYAFFSSQECFDLERAILLAGFAFEAYNQPKGHASISDADPPALLCLC